VWLDPGGLLLSGALSLSLWLLDWGRGGGEEARIPGSQGKHLGREGCRVLGGEGVFGGLGQWLIWQLRNIAMVLATSTVISPCTS